MKAYEIPKTITLRLHGPEAADFLNRMSTANVKQLAANSTVAAALLNAKGQTAGLGYLARISDPAGEFFDFICFHEGKETLHNHLEKFHFQEKLTIENKSSEFKYFFTPDDGVAASLAPLVPRNGEKTDDAIATAPSGPRNDKEWFHRETAFKMGSYFRIPANAKLPQFDPMPYEEYEFLRIQAGIPVLGRDFAPYHEIFLETGFDKAVARNKGCYPGQEVIERIYTYGSVNRKLCRIALECRAPLDAIPPEFQLEQKNCHFTTIAADPANPKKAMALAYVPKGLWDYAASFEIPPAFHGKMLS